jgi:hypothetical protein
LFLWLISGSEGRGVVHVAMAMVELGSVFSSSRLSMSSASLASSPSRHRGPAPLPCNEVGVDRLRLRRLGFGGNAKRVCF